MKDLFIDLETSSSVDLAKAGSYRRILKSSSSPAAWMGKNVRFMTLLTVMS